MVVALLEGLPRGLPIDLAAVDATLRLRQGGAGRGGRQRIEDDRVQILGGVRRGRTIGSPLALAVANRDHSIDDLPEPSRPRPGHGDLAGCFHWLDTDIRSTLERASARETCARVAAGAVCAQLLGLAGTEVLGYVRAVHAAVLPADRPGVSFGPGGTPLAQWRARRDGTRLYTLDADADAAMLERVQEAARKEDTVGGVVEVAAAGVVPGLGSCVQWEEKLDARLAAALMSIPAVKGVEVGVGFGAAAAFGSQVHDPIGAERGGAGGAVFQRPSNRAGGLEAGMTNGQPLVLRAAMKPISTLRQPLASVDLSSGAPALAGYERSDVCAVSACAIVAEAMVALVLADALLERIGGESVGELQSRLQVFLAEARRLGGGGSAPTR
ncbi:MAG: chorismate synthase [Planctomycetes bacterium]|nr:chorismate synthase [Planctomycetota bacterium]